MKRLLVILSAIAMLAACVPTPEEYIKNNTDEAAESITAAQTFPSETAPMGTEYQTEIPTSDPVSYLDALSEDEKQKVLAFAREWYAENFPNYEDLTFEFAKDSDSGYANYPQYKPGELIILKVTSEKSFAGSRRTCFIAMSDSVYEVFNEGW